MVPLLHCNSVLCTIFTWLVTLCSGFVLISSAAGQHSDIGKFFDVGTALVFEWQSNVLLDENPGVNKKVGFLLMGKVTVESVWSSEDFKLLKLQLHSPQLHVKSRKAPTPDGFVSHASELDSYPNKPYLILWNRGRIEKILLSTDEPTSLLNLKKGIASLLQFQLRSGDSTEDGVSNRCKVSYSVVSPSRVTKTKFECVSEGGRNNDEMLGVRVTSKSTTDYIMDESNSRLKEINQEESHAMVVKIKEELESLLESKQHLKLISSEKCDVISSSDFETVLSKLKKQDGVRYAEQTLAANQNVVDDKPKTFSKEIPSQREYLKADHLGTLKSAKAFLHLLKSAKSSTKEDISKALNSKSNKDILLQLYDVLGYAQTKDSHQAVMKKLRLDNEEQIDPIERYLWALSLSPYPNADIIEDLLNKYKKYSNIPEKIKNTLILSVASMSRTLSAVGGHQNYDVVKAIRNVEETIINELTYQKTPDRSVFFAALRNLQSPSSIPTLINFIKTGSSKEEVLAWKAIKSFDKTVWSAELLKLAENALYQLDRKHDSSSRTTGVDILLCPDISYQTLSELLQFVITNETNYEVKQYVFQSVRMLADAYPLFDERVKKIVKGNKMLNNYHGLSPRGLSTALRRDVFSSASSNGSLVSVQEIKSGIVKRGRVDVILDKDSISKELFSLGIFSSGLTSFMSSNGDEEGEEEETTTAGMELTVMGTQIRPFVFFDGQGELMGHVWSGTASEMTPAFQALILAQDYSQHVILGNGFIAELGLKGVISFDLSGKIEISLWNRNAESQIVKSVGYLTKGLIKVESSFVTSLIEFNASLEPKLTLQIDADFSSNVKLCMRLAQPDSSYKHNVFKIERIPGSKHKIRVAKYRQVTSPGKTYKLNRKNDEMCSNIFS